LDNSTTEDIPICDVFHEWDFPMNDNADFFALVAAMIIGHGGLNKLDYLLASFFRVGPNRPQLISVQPNINDADINRNGRLEGMLARPAWQCLPFEIVQH
jgi:hypothetical protein